MKVRHYTLKTLALLFFSISLFGQDLIERTLTNSKLKNNFSANYIAQTIENKKQLAPFIPVSLFEMSSSRQEDNYKDQLTEAIVLEINKQQIESLFQNAFLNIELRIPVTNRRNFNLELTKIDILTSDFALTTSDGQKRTKEELPAVFYRGIVKGDSNSTATLSLFENEVKILITDYHGNYVIAPATETTEKYILYNDKNLLAQNTFECGSDNSHLEFESYSPNEGNSNRENTVSVVEIYVECDYAMYEAHNSNLTSVQNFVAALFNEVATLYANENITIRLSETHVWTEADPYIAYNSTIGVLEAFGEERKNEYNGRLAHLISTRPMNGGVAWLNMLCNSYIPFYSDWNGDGEAELHHAGPYGFTSKMSTTVEAVPTYSWNVNAFAHEIGHNFGSYHTQKCVWGEGSNEALDDCYSTEGSCTQGPTPENGGTVMSYCHLDPSGVNLNNGFGTEPGDLIRIRYETADCLPTEEAETALPLEMLSFDAQLNENNNVLLKWTTTNELNLNYFEVEHSVDGKDWKIMGQIAAQNQSSTIHHYHFLDVKSKNGLQYYRLRQVENDGDFTYSEIKMLKLEAIHSLSINNPVKDLLYINGYTETAQTSELLIYDMQGRLVKQHSMELTSGDIAFEWEVNDLENGIYFIRLSGISENTLKFIKI